MAIGRNICRAIRVSCDLSMLVLGRVAVAPLVCRQAAPLAFALKLRGQRAPACRDGFQRFSGLRQMRFAGELLDRVRTATILIRVEVHWLFPLGSHSTTREGRTAFCRIGG